jgi:hypothetical protein
LTEFASESGPLAIDTEEIAELDRRWTAVESGQSTVSHDNLVRWLGDECEEALRRMIAARDEPKPKPAKPRGS